jgi:hypothetical protein
LLRRFPRVAGEVGMRGRGGRRRGRDLGARSARAHLPAGLRQILARAGECPENMPPRSPRSGVPFFRSATRSHRQGCVGSLEGIELPDSTFMPGPGQRSEGRPAARAFAPGLYLPPEPIFGKRPLGPTPGDELAGATKELLVVRTRNRTSGRRGFPFLRTHCSNREEC